jgi:hypothetical protein
MRFVKNEWLPGAKAVFEKFADYIPRQEGANWLAGGKRILVERVEWVVISDPATAAAALQSGEVDWWERALPDLVPVLRNNRNIVVDIADPLGSTGMLFMNHTYPPFNDVRARGAILMAMSQEDYMRAYVGDDRALWKPMPGFFVPGSPFYNEDGGEILKGPQDINAAKNQLAKSGYSGEPIVCMAAQDLAAHKAWGDVTLDLLHRLGMNVEFVAADWVRWWPDEHRNRLPARAAGACTTPACMGWIRRTRPTSFCAPTARKRCSAGRPFRRSRRRSLHGTTRAPLPRSKQRLAGSTEPRSTTQSMRRSGLICRTMPGGTD